MRNRHSRKREKTEKTEKIELGPSKQTEEQELGESSVNVIKEEGEEQKKEESREEKYNIRKRKSRTNQQENTLNLGLDFVYSQNLLIVLNISMKYFIVSYISHVSKFRTLLQQFCMILCCLTQFEILLS